MVVNKLTESNELEQRAKKHAKRSKGMSPFCSLNPDAGNVEHNIAMFNHANTPADGPSTNPCGPMAESYTEAQSDNTVGLFYDDLEIQVETRPGKTPSYYFQYDRDESQLKNETISYEYYVSEESIIDLLSETVTENDVPNIDNLSSEEIKDAVKSNLDDLLTKYESVILDHYRDYAKQHAEQGLNEAVEPVDKYVILGIKEDGTKQYYNTSSVPNWVDNDKDATIFDDMDEARAIWFEIDKKPFKRVFIPNYKLVNEATEIDTYDKMRLADILYDRVDVLLSMYLDKKYQIIPQGIDAWKINTKAGSKILTVSIDRENPTEDITFTIDGKNTQTVKTEVEAAKIIDSIARRKYVKSFDVAVESVREDWTPPADWVSYKGAWIYPVNDGYEANFMGQHFEAPSINDLKIKVINARSHAQKFVGQYEKANEFASNVEKYGRELPESYQEATKEAIIDWLAEHEQAYKDAQRFFEDMPLDKVDREDLIAWIEDHKQLFNDFKQFFNKVDESISDGRCLESFEDGRRVSNELYRVYDHALELLHDGANADVVNNIERAFESIGGEGFVKAESSTYIKYKGYIPWKGHEEYVIQGSISMSRMTADFNMLAEDITMAYYRTKLDGKLYSTPELMRLVRDHKEVKLHDVQEGWSPDMTDCPACGDVSFDSKRGKCTRCAYRESLDDDDHDDDYDDAEELDRRNPHRGDPAYCPECGAKLVPSGGLFDCPNCSIIESVSRTHRFSEWLEFSDDDVEDDLMHSAVYGGDSKYCKHCGAEKKYDEDGYAFCPECAKIESFDESVEYVKWVQMPDGEWKMWGSNPDDKLDPTFLDRARKRNNIEYLDAKVVKNGESPVDSVPETTSPKEALDEASYGGAYDIADDQYFTKEDLVDCAEKVIEHLNETFEDIFTIADVRLEGTNIVLEVDGEQLGWYMEKSTIDMRKIRKPSDLTAKYALDLASKLIAQIKNYNDML